ncbi:MAG: hypothetical protein WC332_00140 [Clostridia bacterium]|jgi:hypothetical protein
MKIKAIYDQTITKAIRNNAGEVIGYEPTTHHYVFGKVGDDISGGFYIKAGTEIPKLLEVEAEQKIVEMKITLSEIAITIETN